MILIATIAKENSTLYKKENRLFIVFIIHIIISKAIFYIDTKTMKKLLRLVPIVIIAIVAYGIFSYMKPPVTERSTQITAINTTQDIAYDVIKITDGLEVPRAIAFTSPQRMLVTERPWRIRVIENNILQESPLYTVPFISNTSEEWLMSIVLDPNYTDNKWIYISYAYSDGETMYVRVVRFTDAWDSLQDETLIIDQLPAAQRHAGTALAFGPDGMLYITVWDATQSERAQFIDFYNGKILRIFPDGTIPQDNIHPNYATRALWLRNSQGIAWNSKGDMYAVDHGPSIFDGPPGGDEINHIIAKGNYGRPVVSHEKTQTGMQDAIAIYTPAMAPASLMIYQGAMFPEWKDQLFVGMLKWEWILKVQIDPNNPDKIVGQQKIIDNTYGRIRHVTQWPDGSIYFTTSNEDGRWDAQSSGDVIYQIIRK